MANILPTMVDARWYTDDYEEMRALKLMQVCGDLWRNLEPTRMQMIRACRLYGNLPMMGLSPRLYRQRQLTIRNRRISLNVIRSCVDTYVSILTKDQPKIGFVTEGGSWSLQRKAKLIEKFVDGTFYDAGLYITGQAIARDSALFGIGIAKVYAKETKKGPKIDIERVMPWELLVDDMDAADGRPRCMYQVKFVDRRALMAKFPALRDAISMAQSPMFDEEATSYQDINDSVDLIATVEAWALPLEGEDGEDEPGRHTIACGDVLLVDEVYDDEFFPIEILYRQKPIQGIWGEGLADELEAIQVEIARLLTTIQRSQMLAVGHWLVENNAKINTNAINDVVASIFRYSGMKPEFVAYQPVSNDVYSHLDRLLTNAYNIVGISPNAARSEKNPGINSGKAQLVFADIQAQRFLPCYREYQYWYLNLSKQVIHLASKISERHPDFAVKATGKSMMSSVRWLDANLQEEEYVLKLKPENALQDDPAALMQIAQDMANAGLIPPDEVKRLLQDMPDLEALFSLENSPYNFTMSVVDAALDRGEYVPPEPYLGDYLPTAIRIIQMNYLKARLDHYPEDRLALLAQWMSAAAALIPAPPAPPALPPGPPGAPMPGGPPGVPGQVQGLLNGQQAKQTASNLK